MKSLGILHSKDSKHISEMLMSNTADLFYLVAISKRPWPCLKVGKLP